MLRSAAPTLGVESVDFDILNLASEDYYSLSRLAQQLVSGEYSVILQETFSNFGCTGYEHLIFQRDDGDMQDCFLELIYDVTRFTQHGTLFPERLFSSGVDGANHGRLATVATVFREYPS